MAFSILHDEIQRMIQNILHRTLGFRPRRDAIHIIGYKDDGSGSNTLRFVTFSIKDVDYVIDWCKKEIFIRGAEYWSAIDFDGRY